MASTNAERKAFLIEMGGARCEDADCPGYSQCDSCFQETDHDRKIIALRKDAQRYHYLRNADVDAVKKGGLFAGLTPQNLVLNGCDLDEEIDKRLASQNSINEVCNEKSNRTP